MNIHPYCRVIFFIAGVIGTILCTSPTLLASYWLFVLLPLMVLTRNIKTHLNFICLIVLPMAVMLSCWFWIVLPHSLNNFDGIAITVLKLICYTTTIQFALLIPADQVYSTFTAWRMKGDVLITALGSYIVWVDVISRSNKILTARLARGFIAKRTFISKVKQLPHLLIPLVIGIIRTATERAESWDQKRIFHSLERLRINEINYNFFLNLVISIVVFSWLTVNIYLLWK